MERPFHFNKAESQKGMLEVPSALSKCLLIFRSEDEVAGGKIRKKLLERETVHADIGNRRYDQMINLLRQAEAISSEAMRKLSERNFKARADVVEAACYHLRHSSEFGHLECNISTDRCLEGLALLEALACFLLETGSGASSPRNLFDDITEDIETPMAMISKCVRKKGNTTF